MTPGPIARPIADQVTQRPGWSSLATSVRELTIGSQAMVGLLRPCFWFWIWSIVAGLALPALDDGGDPQQHRRFGKVVQPHRHGAGGNRRLLEIGEPVGLAGAVDGMSGLLGMAGLVGDRLPAVGQIMAEGQLRGAKRRGDCNSAQKCLVNL